MSSQDAARKGVCRYKIALARSNNAVEAYIKGLDYIIDTVFKGDDMLSPHVLSAIGQYEKAIEA